MIFIKTFEQFTSESDNIETLLFYIVSKNTEFDSEMVIKTTDYNEAKKCYDNIDNSDFDNDDTRLTKELSKSTYTYRYIYSEDKEDYLLEDYYDDKEVYKLIDTTEPEIVLSDSFDSKDESYKQECLENYSLLEDDIVSYIKSVTSIQKKAGMGGRTLYCLKPYLDGYIMIRFANHYFNIRNVNLGRDVNWNEEVISYDKSTYSTENIYGFLSVQLFGYQDEYWKDRRGFISDYKNRKTNYIDVLNIKIEDYTDEKITLDDIISEIEQKIENIESSIGDEYLNLDLELDLDLNESIRNSFEYDNVEYVDIDIIKRFREFDRLLVPKYSKEDSDETINNLVSDIKINGIKNPLILDYFVYDNKALLIEGNHRLNAAILAGLKEVPVRVVRSKRDAPTKAVRVRGFIKKHEHQHIPSDLKPSEIGIETRIVESVIPTDFPDIPKIVYHGQPLLYDNKGNITEPIIFNRFDQSQKRFLHSDNYGFYFTPFLETAKDYAEGGNVYVCELDIKNPYLYSEHKENIIRSGTFINKKDRDLLFEQGYDSVILYRGISILRKIIEIVVFDNNQIKILDII